MWQKKIRYRKYFRKISIIKKLNYEREEINSRTRTYAVCKGKVIKAFLFFTFAKKFDSFYFLYQTNILS